MAKKPKKKKRGPNKQVRMRRLLKKCSEAWSLAVRTRDGKCLVCGATENLQAHHWLVSRARSRKYRFDLRNGVTLCYGHHLRGIHTEASLAFLMLIMKNVTFITQEQAIEIAGTAGGEVSDPFTEEELDATLSRLNAYTANAAALREAAREGEALEDAAFIERITP